MPENPQENNGWWLASDGQWYPPEPTTVPPKRNFVARHKILTISLAIVTALVVLGAVSPKKVAVKTAAKVAQPVVAPARPRPKAPVTTVPPTTEPPTTVAPATTVAPPTTSAPTTTEPATVPLPPPTASPRPTAATPTVAPPTTVSPQLLNDMVIGIFKAGTQQVTASQLANDPSTYNGSTVRFAATITNFLQDANGWTTAMNVSDPADFTSSVYVQLSGFAEVAKMNKGDAVTIWGDATGTASGKNAFGGTINVSTVTEVYLSDATTGYVDNSDTNPR